MGNILKYYCKWSWKKSFDDGLTDPNHVAIDGTIKKAYNSNNYPITKKETLICADYYERGIISKKTIEKLNKKPITTQNNNILKK